MATNQEVLTCPPISELDDAEHHRKSSLALGIVSIILGTIAFAVPVLTTVAAVLFIGSMLLVNGIVQIYQNFRSHTGRESLIHLLISILYIVAGVLMIINPAMGAISLTLVLTFFFIVAGAFRIFAAVSTRFKSWGWVLFNGIVTFIMGLLIWAGWPLSGLWVVGLFVAIEMIINGWALVMFALATRAGISQIRLQCEAV